MKRLWVALLAVLALAGCGVQPSGVIRGAGPPSGAVDESAMVRLYLVSGGAVRLVTRPGPPLSRADLLGLLVQGPTARERAQGLSTEVPPEAAPFSVSADPSGRVVVTLSVPPDTLSTVATEQIVCTAAKRGGQVILLGAGQDGGPVACPD